jgi:RND superfamily putative drug exporter
MLARWCFRHRILVAILWLLGLACLATANQVAGSAYSYNLTLPDTESTRATNLLKSAFPNQSGEQDFIVWHLDQGSVTDPAIQQRIGAMLDRVAKVPSVGKVISPYDPTAAAQRSRDGRTAYATVVFTKSGGEIDSANVTKIISLAEDARTTGLRVELGGNAIQLATQTPASTSEIVGLAAAAVVLLIAFGSVVAMLTPLIIAVVSLFAAVMTVGLASHGLSIFNMAPTIAALVGIGVGVDYALFIVTRYRAGMKEGLSPEEATVRALNTSGRAVIFAGATVCVALLGILIMKLAFLSGIGISAAIMVFFTVLASCTLLPAMLGFLGTRLLSRRERADSTAADSTAADSTAADSTATDSTAAAGGGQKPAKSPWERWSELVARNPRRMAIIALIVAAVLVLPAFSLRLGFSDQSNDPKGRTTREAYDLIADGFGPGFNGQFQLITKIQTQQDGQAFTALADVIRRSQGVASAQVLLANPETGIGIMVVVPTTSPQAKETSDLIQRLRKQVIPPAMAGTGMRVYVGGQTAAGDDFSAAIGRKMPLFMGVIVFLGFLLLLIAFRSVLSPLTAALMNLLSAGAAFGVVVALFQWGWGEHIGLGAPSPIEAFLPVLMLAVLFGLSMDYQVFLVSRMHEEWVRTRDNRRAIITGQASTARVVVAAAAIMICVFCAFALGGKRIIAEFGIGLASAVLVDAFILRTVLVPALMHLFGRANWWLPRFIDKRMPHLSVEPRDDAAAEPKPAMATV